MSVPVRNDSQATVGKKNHTLIEKQPVLVNALVSHLNPLLQSTLASKSGSQPANELRNRKRHRRRTVLRGLREAGANLPRFLEFHASLPHLAQHFLFKRIMNPRASETFDMLSPPLFRTIIPNVATCLPSSENFQFDVTMWLFVPRLGLDGSSFWSS